MIKKSSYFEVKMVHKLHESRTTITQLDLGKDDFNVLLVNIMLYLIFSDFDLHLVSSQSDH
jgi:hypothetical protein